MACKTEAELLAETTKAIGPKVFKTKDVEIQAHDPGTVYDLHRKLQVRTPATFCQLNTCIAKPSCE